MGNMPAATILLIAIVPVRHLHPGGPVTHPPLHWPSACQLLPEDCGTTPHLLQRVWDHHSLQTQLHIKNMLGV